MQILSGKTRLNKISLLMVVSFILSINSGLCQKRKEKISVSIVGSAFFNSKRHEYRNGEQGIYKEIRAGYPLNKNFELGIFAGHQWRSFIYYKRTPNSLTPLFMDRNYLPAGVSLRINFTDFLENAGIVKNKENWELYNQIIVSRLFGKDKRDKRETSQDVIEYYPSYVIEYGKIYLGFLIGVTYYPYRKIGVFMEGGDGAIATLQTGIKIRFQSVQ